MTKAGIFFLALMLAFGGFYLLKTAGLFGAGPTSGSTATADEVTEDNAEQSTSKEEWLTSFQLTDQFGKPFDSRDLEGEFWVGNFFFSRCPSSCRELNLRVAELQRHFGDRGLKLVSISCDPEYDTPSRLAVYGDKFGADYSRWSFLTGDLTYIRRIGAEIFTISVMEQTHSDRITIFDREGKKRGSFVATKGDEFLKAKKLLDELLPAAAEEQDS